MTSAGRRLVVIGGGVIGLSCAFEAACAGWDVTVVDPQPGRGAGWVALTRLLVAGAGVWPKFAADLELAIGGTVGFEVTGSLLAAKDAGDRSDLIRTLEFQRSLGLNVEELRPAALRSLEPNLSPTLAAGALLPNDHQVSNRLLLAGLVRACIESGVSFVHEEATALGWSGSRATVQLGSGDSMTSESLLLDWWNPPWVRFPLLGRSRGIFCGFGEQNHSSSAPCGRRFAVETCTSCHDATANWSLGRRWKSEDSTSESRRDRSSPSSMTRDGCCLVLTSLNWWSRLVGSGPPRRPMRR